MRKVHLYGALATQFGKQHSFHIDSVPEAIQALRANFPNFAAALREGFYRVVVGKSQKHGVAIGEDELVGLRLGSQDLHIVPVVKGSKRGGLGKIIAGIALIGLSVFTGGLGGMFTATLGGVQGGLSITSAIAGIGQAMLLTGVASLLAPEQKDTSDKEKSFTSSGPVTSTREGGIIPIVYGEVITGGVMVNGILSVTKGNGSAVHVPASPYSSKYVKLKA